MVWYGYGYGRCTAMDSRQYSIKVEKIDIYELTSTGYPSIQQCRAAFAFARARCNCFLTSIRIWIVLALRLAQWREMVSRPPEKTHLTARVLEQADLPH